MVMFLASPIQAGLFYTITLTTISKCLIKDVRVQTASLDSQIFGSTLQSAVSVSPATITAGMSLQGLKAYLFVFFVFN